MLERYLTPLAGEVTIDLAQSPLDEEAEWHYLTTYKVILSPIVSCQLARAALEI